VLKEINGVDKGRGQLEENRAVGLDAHAQWREGGYGIGSLARGVVNFGSTQSRLLLNATINGYIKLDDAYEL